MENEGIYCTSSFFFWKVTYQNSSPLKQKRLHDPTQNTELIRDQLETLCQRHLAPSFESDGHKSPD